MLVSIITPAYNAEKFLEQTILSVIYQTYQNWELILVIDHKSKDQTLMIAQAWAANDPRIQCHSEQKTTGSAENRNFGIKVSKGEYLAFIDADDIWHSDKLRQQLQFMQSQGHTFSYTGFCRIDESGALLSPGLPIPERIRYKELLKNNIIGCSTVMLCKGKFSDIYFENLGWEDLALWLKLLKQIPWAYGLPEALVSYRHVSGSRSNNKLYAAWLRWLTLRKSEKIPFVKALFYFIIYGLSGLKKHWR